MQDHSDGKTWFPQAPENGQAHSLRRDVNTLALDIGPRNLYHYEALQRAASYIETALRDAGYTPLLNTYEPKAKVL